MAKQGKIQQFKGPFAIGEQIQLKNRKCKIGISIDEKDFMRISKQNSSFIFEIENQVIYMGRTCIYQCLFQKTTGQSNIKIFFPMGAPLSTIVDVTYMGSEV